jgi:hypothetical protein
MAAARQVVLEARQLNRLDAGLRAGPRRQRREAEFDPAPARVVGPQHALRQHQHQAAPAVVGQRLARAQAVVVEGQRAVQAEGGRADVEAGQQLTQHRQCRIRAAGGGRQVEFEPALHRLKAGQRRHGCGQRAAGVTVRQDAQPMAVEEEAEQRVQRRARLAPEHTRRGHVASQPDAAMAIDGLDGRLFVELGGWPLDGIDGDHRCCQRRCSASVKASISVR